jgi:hypothetical protein
VNDDRQRPEPAPVPEKIRIAVRDGLAICVPVRSPLAQLTLFLDYLQDSGDWGSEEIFEVDTRIRRFLTILADSEA